MSKEDLSHYIFESYDKIEYRNDLLSLVVPGQYMHQILKIAPDEAFAMSWAWSSEEEGDFLIGAVLLRVDRTFPPRPNYDDLPHPNYDLSAYVKEEHRRKGIGKKLIEMLRDDIDRLHAEKPMHVWGGSEVAHAFWKSQGFYDICVRRRSTGIPLL